MRVWTFFLAMSVLPLFADGWDGKAAPVVLYADFQQTPSDSVLKATQDELAQVMSPAGLHFVWYPLSDAGERASARLAVIRFKGECDSRRLYPQQERLGPFGSTHVSGGKILPFIEINCESLRAFVQRDLLRVPQDKREAIFGRAVARVLAHELYHLLANTQSHARSGIAQAYYSVAELLAQSLHFGRKECEALRSYTAARLSFDALAESE